MANKKFNFKKIIFSSSLILFLFIILLGADSVSADITPLVQCGTNDPNTGECNICHIFQLISRVITFILFYVIFPLSAIAFVVGGVFLLTSSGNPGQITTGRKIIINTIIGFLIAFSAWLIVDTIIGNIANKDLVRSNIYFPWNEFPSCNTTP